MREVRPFERSVAKSGGGYKAIVWSARGMRPRPSSGSRQRRAGSDPGRGDRGAAEGEVRHPSEDDRRMKKQAVDGMAAVFCGEAEAVENGRAGGLWQAAEKGDLHRCGGVIPSCCFLRGPSGSMRGADEGAGFLFSYVDSASRFQPKHPLRAIRAIANEALSTLDDDFARLLAGIGYEHLNLMATRTGVARPEKAFTTWIIDAAKDAGLPTSISPKACSRRVSSSRRGRLQRPGNHVARRPSQHEGDRDLRAGREPEAPCAIGRHQARDGEMRTGEQRLPADLLPEVADFGFKMLISLGQKLKVARPTGVEPVFAT